MFTLWLTKYRLRILVSLLVLPVMTTMAQQQEKKDEQIDRAQAIEKVKKDTQGRVLKVNQNRDKYKVKVLQKSGRVVSVDVDKKSGKITKPKSSKDRDNR
ncbi:PepSY domain-containing protein [Neptunicella sp. SCSIO 80796]|uniref:PepSY domain-containing protein n=1 Tax=Neptunicella plasticusilytica TaxID=3117012 RepID=UPI003A4E6380